MGSEPGVGVSPSTGAARRARQVKASETRLLYANAGTGIVVTLVIASILAYAQWNVIPAHIILLWSLYMLLVSAVRWLIVRGYRRASPSDDDIGRWNAALIAGVAMAAAGWGAAGIALYRPDRPMNQTFLVFVVGGVMLGGASLLAARVEAFVTFLLPTGLLMALRLASEGDPDHLMMGFLSALFTAATLATTWRFHWMIESSFKLRFDNADLIEGLEAVNRRAEASNRDLELRVRDRTAKLVEADRRKDEFLATLAHELRNPLAPIRFALENLKPGAASEHAARARDVIDRQVRQLVRLVDDLLDVSRITTDKIQLRREPQDLARLMSIAAESIAPMVAAAGHQLDVELPSSPLWVDGDGARLVQILANVLNNAVKFTPGGGRIRFAADRQSTDAVLRIEDTGIGIAPDVLPRVFEMFEQTEPVLQRAVGGLGIGLTLARRLVEMHGGRIAVSSPGIGQGTNVEIRLPVLPVPAEASPAVERSAPTAARMLRVLIAEDNVDAAEMMQLVVSTLGHTTSVAHDGATAVTRAVQFKPDLILLDIGLPVMNGYEVVRRLRELPEFTTVHIAAVTGWGQEEDRRKAREAGFDSHFIKPLSPDMLQELLVSVAHPVPMTR